MSTVDNNEIADNPANVEDDGVDLPDDFFDEFEDSKFLDEIVEIVVPEQTRLISTNHETNNGSPTETNNDQRDQRNDDDGITKSCLDRIDNLEKSIKRRKQRLQNEMQTKQPKRRSPPSRSDRNVRSRDRRSPSGPRCGRRGRSRSRDRSNHSRERRTSRRDRSRSGSPINHQSRGMSFLEELEHKFAEKGQDFPEKNLLIQLRAKNNNVPLAVDHNPIGYPQDMPMYGMPPYMQMPMYNQPYQPYWNGNYMMEHMPSNMQQMPFVPSRANDAATNNVIYSASKDSECTDLPEG